MKKLMIFAAIVLTWTACGNKTNSATTDADSTQVFEVPDTLNTVEAVIKQVNAVYDHWNAMRENYKEGMPSLDELFGTKEWQQVVAQADSVTRECECGGFFDFGDEGPLDPWLYDCYEGRVSADSIEAKILPNGMADVKFLVKDAMTIKGIPMRWLMRVEDGAWRVANIFFEKDGGMDLLQGMKEYITDATVDKHSEAYIRQRLDAIYSDIRQRVVGETDDNHPYMGPGFNPDSAYCSSSYYGLLKEAIEIADKTGDIVLDYDHWVCGQDFSRDWNYQIQKVYDITDSTASADIIVINFGNKNNVTLSLCFERGDWYVDEFGPEDSEDSEKAYFRRIISEGVKANLSDYAE